VSAIVDGARRLRHGLVQSGTGPCTRD
jgi:hypothetical protein